MIEKIFKQKETKKSICIYGSENINWSIDKDIKFLKEVYDDDEYFITNLLFADTIFIMNWNMFYDRYKLILPIIAKFKNIIVWLSNDISHNRDYTAPLVLYANKIICSNTSQKRVLLEHNIPEAKLHLLPYWVDPSVFFPNEDQSGLNEITKNKAIVIGSFQRDSLGSDLTQPKWQKGPDFLIDHVKELMGNIEFELVLAGPRRHYVIQQLHALGCSTYVFHGDKTYVDDMKDDIDINNLADAAIAQLYHEIDCYVVTSKSEGGPKAIMECLLTNCTIFSTDVGVANDLLGSDFIYSTTDELISKLKNLNYYKEKFSDKSEKFRSKYNKYYYESILRGLIE